MKKQKPNVMTTIVAVIFLLAFNLIVFGIMIMAFKPPMEKPQEVAIEIEAYATLNDSGADWGAYGVTHSDPDKKIGWNTQGLVGSITKDHFVYNGSTLGTELIKLPE